MSYDPEVESPATIAVIGAGPVGIEAALYGRFLGYDVEIFDAGRPARKVTQWNGRSMVIPVHACTTPLGHAAIGSHDDTYTRRDANDVYTGKELAEEYLIAVAKTDLLIDSIHINSPIVDVSRIRCGPHETDDLQERANDEFRLVVQSRDRGFYTSRADIVLDCRGLQSDVAGLGPGGGKAIGEDWLEKEECKSFVLRWLPEDPRFELRQIKEKRLVVFGASNQARRMVCEWIGLLGDSPDLKLTWVVPVEPDDSSNIEDKDLASQGKSALHEFLDLPLAALVGRLKKLADLEKSLAIFETRGVERIEWLPNESATSQWKWNLLQHDDSTVDLYGDMVAAFPERIPTRSISPTLLAHLPATECNNDWAGWDVATGEPHYYLLGSRDFPNDPRGLSECFDQIRDLYALLGNREDLNLYQIIELQQKNG